MNLTEEENSPVPLSAYDCMFVQYVRSIYVIHVIFSLTWLVLVKINNWKLCVESHGLNRKAYILSLFIGLVCAEPNALLSHP